MPIGLLPMRARMILKKAAETRTGDTNQIRKLRIEAAHLKVQELFPQYFQEDYGGVHEVRSEGQR